MTLSIAATDVALVRGNRPGDRESALAVFARGAIDLSIDGKELRSNREEVVLDEEGARIRMVFAHDGSSDAHHLVLASEVPKRMARGHRELVVITAYGRVVSETLLDAGSVPIAVDLAAPSPPAARVAVDFLRLGVGHILSGYDHLAFLAGLLLASCTVRQVATALTAFTAAHSLTLGLIAAGGVHVPPSVVEPLIAASIAWVGLETLMRTKHEFRWRVVFVFGLIHGLGFGEGLTQLGVGNSTSERLLALLSFNVGVEAGQLAVAAAVLPVIWILRSTQAWNAKLLPACSIMVAGAGMYWLIERLHSSL